MTMEYDNIIYIIPIKKPVAEVPKNQATVIHDVRQDLVQVLRAVNDSNDGYCAMLAISARWWFPKSWGYLQIIHFRMFHEINHPAIRDPPFMETPKGGRIHYIATLPPLQAHLQAHVGWNARHAGKSGARKKSPGKNGPRFLVDPSCQIWSLGLHGLTMFLRYLEGIFLNPAKLLGMGHISRCSGPIPSTIFRKSSGPKMPEQGRSKPGSVAATSTPVQSMHCSKVLNG